MQCKRIYINLKNVDIDLFTEVSKLPYAAQNKIKQTKKKRDLAKHKL